MGFVVRKRTVLGLVTAPFRMCMIITLFKILVSHEAVNFYTVNKQCLGMLIIIRFVSYYVPPEDIENDCLLD
jgi:hypothetical protein